jgi:hypothetical protein
LSVAGKDKGATGSSALPSPPDAQKQLAFELAECTIAEKNFKELRAPEQ